MSDLNEVWNTNSMNTLNGMNNMNTMNTTNTLNTNRTAMISNTLANSSFPRNQLGPSYAPYTQEDVSGVGEHTQLGYANYSQDGYAAYTLPTTCNSSIPYQPKNVYSTTLGMAPAVVITPDYLNTLFSNEYFLKLLGEFMIANNMTNNKEAFTLKSIDTGIFDIIFKIIVILMMIIILFKVK